MSTSLQSTLTNINQSFNQWRRDNNKSVLGVGDLSSVYTTDGAGGDSVAVSVSKYVIGSASLVSNIGTTVTIQLSSEHNLKKDGSTYDTIVVSGCTPSDYNGTYPVSAIIDDYTFSYVLASTPATYVSGCVVSYYTPDVITVLTDLNTRKVKRSGDSIAYLNITNATAATNTTSGALIVTGGMGLGGKLYIGNDFTVATNKFTVASASGNTVVAGTLAIAGDVNVNSGKFTVAASTGNTTVYGTLGVTGLATLASVSITGGLAITSGGTGITSITSSANKLLGVNAASGAYELKQLTSSGATVTITYPSAGVLNVETSAVLPGSLVTPTDVRIGTQLLVGSWSGSVYNPLSSAPNVSSLEVRPGSGPTYNYLVRITTDNAGSTPIITVDPSGNLKCLASTAATNATSGALVVTGGVGISGKLWVTDDFNINTNKFNVVAASGNTTIAGTLGISGTTTFSGVVTATSANTVTLSPTGGGTVTINPATAGSISNCSISATTIAGSGDFAIATTKFTVASATGNTAVLGTLGVTGTTSLGVLNTTGNVAVGAAVGVLATIGSNCVITTYSTTTSSGSANQVVALVDATIYQSVEFIVQAKDTTGGRYQNTHILAVCNGSATDYTEFGSVQVSGLYCGLYSVDYNSGNIRLLVTPFSANSTVYKVTAIMTKI